MKKIIISLFVVILTGCATLTPAQQKAHEENEALTRQTKIFNEKCGVALNRFDTEIPSIQIKNVDDYNDFKGLSLTLDTVLGNATSMTDQNCHPKAYNVAMRSCVVNVSGSECYKKLKSKNDQIKEALRQFREPIYKKEETAFKNKYGGEFKKAFNFCISAYNNCSCPADGEVFVMQPGTAKIFQNLGNAALLANPYVDTQNVIYISANFAQPDGSILNKEFFLQAVGLKTYQTPIGASKTVCAYKILNYSDVKAEIDGFLFYTKI